MQIVKVSSSSHWYKPDATPMHTIIGKNGKERSTTVKDARELGLLPSVTTILGVLANPGLDAWKSEQLVLSALTLPKLENEPLDDYAKRVVRDSREHSRSAADVGTKIHDSIATFYKNNEITIEGYGYLFKELKNHKFEGDFELRFAAEGYAGCIDFLGYVTSAGEKELALIDFKTQGTKEGKYKIYDNWKYQLCAYRKAALSKGLVPDNLYNLVISTTEPLLWLYKYTQEDIEKGTKIFEHLKEVFYLTKGLK